MTQTELAYAEISHRILVQELAPGDRLKEEEWAARLNVSRAAISESLTRLQGENLVRPGTKGGFLVSEMTERDVHEIREVREVLETAAFSMACERASRQKVAELEEACNDFANLAKKGYWRGACEADLRFHHLLVAASGNSRLAQLYGRAHIPLFQCKLSRSIRS